MIRMWYLNLSSVYLPLGSEMLRRDLHTSPLEDPEILTNLL
jgi:hypothetical protein